MKLEMRGKKEDQIYRIQSNNSYNLLKKIVQIGPVDPEIIGLQAVIKKD